MIKFLDKFFGNKKDNKVNDTKSRIISRLSELSYIYSEEFVSDPRRFDFEATVFMNTCMSRCDQFVDKFLEIKDYILSELRKNDGTLSSESSENIKKEISEIENLLIMAHKDLSEKTKNATSMGKEEQLDCYNNTTEFRSELRRRIEKLLKQ